MLLDLQFLGEGSPFVPTVDVGADTIWPLPGHKNRNHAIARALLIADADDALFLAALKGEF